MPTSTTTYGNLAPHTASRPLWGWLAGNAQNLMQSPQGYYPGQGYVSPSGLTQQGVNAGAGAQGGYTDAAGQNRLGAGLLGGQADQLLSSIPGVQQQLGTSNQNYNFLSGAADVANNPYVQAQLGQNAKAVNTQLAEQWLPQIRGSAQAVNALGSSRQGLAEGVAAGKAADALAQANASTMLGAYGQGLGAQQTALGYTGQHLANQLAPANVYGQAGMARGQAGGMFGGASDYQNQAAQNLLGYGRNVEGYQQQALQDQMARWQFAQQEPWTRMGNVGGFAQMFDPLGVQTGGGSSVSMQGNPGYMSPYQGAKGGAMSGGAFGNAIGDWWNSRGK
jgi:hypothetical protein